LRHVQGVFAAGCVAGNGAAAVTNQLLQAALADLPTLTSNLGAMLIAGIVLAATALGAALVPAWRAGRIDVTAVLSDN
jgi:ABC-type lipoprotein release transport system permease subunit